MHSLAAVTSWSCTSHPSKGEEPCSMTLVQAVDSSTVSTKYGHFSPETKDGTRADACHGTISSHSLAAMMTGTLLHRFGLGEAARGRCEEADVRSRGRGGSADLASTIACAWRGRGGEWD